VSEKIHELAEEALSRLADIMRNGEDRDSIRASEVLMDKAIKLPKNEPIRKQLNQFTNDDLVRLLSEGGAVASARDPLLE